MLKKITVCIALIIGVLLMSLFFVEYIKDKPKIIFNAVVPEDTISKTAKPLPEEGEKLSYLIKYLWVIPVGTAEIEVGKKEGYKNRTVYPLTANGKVSNFMSYFIKAEGSIKSYVDTVKLYPWRYEEKTRAEGHRPSDKVIVYHQDAQIMEFKDIKRKIPRDTQDPLSALFYLRWQDYKKNEDIEFNVNSNKENYTLHTKFLRETKVKSKKGVGAFLVTESYIRSPKEYSKSEAKITTYVINNTTRIPVLMKIRTKFGPLTIRLIEVEYK